MKIKINRTNWTSINYENTFRIFYIKVNDVIIWNYEILEREGNLSKRLLEFKIFKKKIVGKTKEFQQLRVEYGLPFY